ncbi:MAG: YegS/Rv2252/BmrU family lipid kinase [Clostridia bacterium]|nr:YegS/Rv2252/BmrU family lipid kinase [Clostridia bacterium]
MRNIFIINPCAGQGKNIDALKSEITKTCKKMGIPAEIYITNFVGDATDYVRKLGEETIGQELRIIACGGDGTLNEVVNGAIGYEHITVGVIPVGTGNDYVRNYGDPKFFMSVKEQLLGKAKAVDVIKYEGVLNDRFETRYCINMFNVGFDCNVVDKTAELKEKPLLSGSTAYLAGVANILIKKKGENLRIIVEDEVVHEGPLLLTAIACGSYCGGGVYSSPQAKTDDGLMDVNVIKDMSRTKFISLFPKYSKGTHFEVEGIDRFINAKACKSARIEPLDKSGIMRLCVDGEIVDAGDVNFEMVPLAIRFNIPEKLVDKNL